MADIQKTIEIIFGATDKTDPALTGVAAKVDAVATSIGGIGSKFGAAGDLIDGFVNRVSGVTAPLASVGDTLLKTEAGIVAFGAALLSVSVNEAAKFQEATLSIGTLFDATGAQAGAFGVQIQDFASKSTQSLDSINAAVKVAIGTGIEQAKSLEFVAEAEKLAVAGGADLEKTTLGLVSSLNAYGVGTDQAAHFSDVFFQTVNLGNVSVEQLSSLLANITPVASAAGVPIETLGAGIALLTAKGLPAGQAVDGLRDMISNIIKPSEQATQEAARLGVQFDAAALQSKGLEGVLMDVMTATHGNVGEMSLLFGNVQGLTAALALGAGGGAQFKDFLDQMANSAGATDKAFKLMSESVSLQLQNLQNNLKNTLIDAGKPLLDDFAGLLGSLSDVFKALRFSIDSGAFDPIYQALESASAGLTTFLEGVAKALPEALRQVDFSGLVGSFGGLGDAIKGLFGNLDLTKPEDLAKAIQFVVDSVTSLTQITKEMVEAWGPAIQTLVGTAGAFNDTGDKAKAFVGNILAISQQFEFFKGILTGFSAGLQAVGAGLETIGAVMGTRLAVQAVPAAIAGVTALSVALGPGGIILAISAAVVAIELLIFKLNSAKDPAGTYATELQKSADIVEQTQGKYYGVILAIQNFTDAMAASGTKATDVQSALSGLHDGTLTYEEALKLAGATSDEAKERFDALRGVYDQMRDATDQAAAKQAGLTSEIEKNTEAAKANEAQTVKVTSETGKQGQVYFANLDAFDAWAKKTDAAREAQAALGQYTDQTTDKTSNFIKTINSDGTVTFTQNLAKAATNTAALKTETDKAAAATAAAAKAQEEWNHKLTEMQFQAQLEQLKSATAITTAAIEADASKVTAAFAASASSVEALSQEITKLASTNAPDWDRFGFNLEAAFDQAMELQRAEVEAQIKLTEAQIQNMQIKNDLLRQGMPQVLIQADGLEPHIEAFMFEILRRIQVKASQLGAAWLTGGGMVSA